jgi:hypothetical protein
VYTTIHGKPHFLFLFFFLQGVGGWEIGSLYLAQIGLKFVILLPWPKCQKCYLTGQLSLCGGRQVRAPEADAISGCQGSVWINGNCQVEQT